VQRIRETLPATAGEFLRDRTAREIVVLNLFVALQESASLAAHWIADEGASVPQSYREVFAALAERGVVSGELAARLADASGLRNLIAHRYGVLDWARIHAIAAADLEDLLALCAAVSARVE
jgi:uncharacterized protein YutE (UPF0331/DUF86 family)